MTTIRATCPSCGEVNLTTAQITLNVSRTRPDRSHYAFVCPTCTAVVTKPTDAHVVNFLTSGGAVLATAWEPQPYPEVIAWQGLPGFSEDDLISFGLHLSKIVSVSWFADLGIDPPCAKTCSSCHRHDARVEDVAA